LAQAGVELRIAIAPPRCQADAARQAQCASACAGSGPECAAVCQLQSELYGRCSLPGISVAASSEAGDVVALARALERHLPGLVYAQLALGKRLSKQGSVLVEVGARLPADLRQAGPRGLACVGLATTTLGKSVAHMNNVVSSSLSLTASLDPEISGMEAMSR
jgi:hypothetical protein